MEIPEIIHADYITHLINKREDILKEATRCMSQLSSFIEESSGRDMGQMSLLRIMESITVNNILEQQACHDTAPEKVTSILETLISCLDDSPPPKRTSTAQSPATDAKASNGIDILLLADYLIRLSRHQGLLLPFLSPLGLKESAQNPVSASASSLHTVENPAEEQNLLLWQQLSSRMTRLASERLLIVLHAQGPEQEDEFGRLVEVLLLTNTPVHTWQLYKDCRLKALDARIQIVLKASPQPPTLPDLAVRWRRFTQEAIDMLATDCRFFGFLSSVVSNAQDALLNQYLDCIGDAIRMFADLLPSGVVAVESGKQGTVPEVKLTSAPVEKSPRFLSVSSDNSSGGRGSGSTGTSSTLGSPTQVLTEVAFLAVAECIAAWARLENKFLALINSHWTSPIGVDMEAVTTSKKPKGVLKKMRRGSRRLSADISEFKAAERAPTTAPSPMIEEGPVSLVPYLEWQAELEPSLGLIADSLGYYLGKQWRQVRLATEPTICRLLPDGPDVPRRISQSLQDYLRLVERVVAMVIAASCDEVTEPLVSAFKESVCGHLQLMLESLATETGSRSVDRLALAASDAHCLQTVCFHLATLFMPKKETMGVYFFERRKQCQDISSSLARRIVELSMERLLTSVLHDPESNYWTDSKEFYEEERVGFPIQGWHLHLSRLWHTVATRCPAPLAREVLLQVLIRSLEFLVQRYAAASPSFRRVKQIRADMIAILHIVEHNLYKVSDSAEDLLGFGEEHSQLRRIHYAAMSLMQVVVVLCAPLHLLERVHGKGFYRSRDNRNRREYFPAYWLTCIHPTLYGPLREAQNLKEMLSTNALLVQVDLFVSTPHFDPLMALELLTSRNAALSVLLLTHLSQIDGRSQLGSQAIFAAFFRIFASLTSPPDALSLLLVPICDRTNSWSSLEKFGPNTTSAFPAWMLGLFDALERHVTGICDSLKRLVTSRRRQRLDLDDRVFPDGLLPCGCAAKPSVRSSGVGDEYMQYSELGSALLSEALSLSPSLQVALVGLDERAVERGVSPLGGYVVFHLLLRAVRYFLEKGGSSASDLDTLAAFNKLCQVIEDADDLQNEKETMIHYLNRIVCDHMNPQPELETGLLGKKFFLGQQLSRVTGRTQGLSDLRLANELIRRNVSWIRHNLGGSLRQEQHGVDDEEEENSDGDQHPRGTTADYGDVQPKGGEGAEGWLPRGDRSRLPLGGSGPRAGQDRGAWSGNRPRSKLNFQLPQPQEKVDERENEAAFDPLVAAVRLGEEKFNHAKFVSAGKWLDWPELCSAELGMSEVGLRGMLAHRWELQPDLSSELDEAETEMAQRLAERYRLAESPSSS